jgi:hypothetical protein
MSVFAHQAAARVDKKRESPSMEILERVRTLTLVGQQRAAAGDYCSCSLCLLDLLHAVAVGVSLEVCSQFHNAACCVISLSFNGSMCCR